MKEMEAKKGFKESLEKWVIRGGIVAGLLWVIAAIVT